jgi:spore coat polysaccharide biosynthesis protein SpsF (cytidylyltransferase family)
MTAIIVCARLASKRLPRKCGIEIAGKSVLQHLHERLRLAGLPIIYAVPEAELEEFVALTADFEGELSLFAGYDSDPLARMYQAAIVAGADTVIRITHDKIFVDLDQIQPALNYFSTMKLEYLYSSKFIAGTQFEVISTVALGRASEKYKDVEFISYAVRSVTDRQADVYFGWPYNPRMRLLIDHPEDINLMEMIFRQLGPDCTLRQVRSLWLNTPWIQAINQMPYVTIYTCAFNAEPWIEKAMGSVSMQKNFSEHEYILVDDASTDRTGELMQKFAGLYPNVKYLRNETNLGLASSSNVALGAARGDYIVRLDADDYFTTPMAIEDLVETALKLDVDAVYPSNYHGKTSIIQSGDEAYHVGGALFRTRALNFVRFTDGLRHHDSLDLYARARAKLKVGLLNKAIFLYRQRPDSMSKSEPEKRAQIEAEIRARGDA